jgi:hypothetical protein
MPIVSGGGGGGTQGTELGYDQITANVTVASTTEATGTTVITCAAHVFDGAAVIAEFFSPVVVPNVAAGGLVVVSLFESTTQIGRFGAVENTVVTVAALDVPFYARIRFTPTAASHTYTVTAHQGNGNGTVGAGAAGTGAYPPAFVRFTKV